MSTSDNVILISNYLALVFVLAGVIGNISMYVVFSRKGLKKISVSMYFRALALINLFITINWIKIFLLYHYDFSLVSQSIILCKSVTYLIYTVSPISAWLLVVAGLDRFVSIVYPAKYLFMRKPRFSLIVILIIVIFNAALYFHMFSDFQLSTQFDNSTNLSSTYCEESSPTLSTFLDVSDLFNSSILPFMVMLACSIATLVGVRNSRNRMKHSNSQRSKRSKFRDIRFGMNMVVLNIIFLIFNIPFPAYNILRYLNIFNDENIANYYAVYFIVFVWYLFYAMGFYFQLMSNSLVRRHFFEIFIPKVRFSHSVTFFSDNSFKKTVNNKEYSFEMNSIQNKT